MQSLSEAILVSALILFGLSLYMYFTHIVAFEEQDYLSNTVELIARDVASQLEQAAIVLNREEILEINRTIIVPRSIIESRQMVPNVAISIKGIDSGNGCLLEVTVIAVAGEPNVAISTKAIKRINLGHVVAKCCTLGKPLQCIDLCPSSGDICHVKADEPTYVVLRKGNAP